MKIIPYTNREGKSFKILVDNEDYNDLIQFKWHVNTTYFKNGSTYSSVKCRKLGKMHRYLMRKYGYDIDGKIVDHKNRITTDNQKENLRITDFKGNSRNLSKFKTSTTGYIGVTQIPEGSFRLQIYDDNGKRKQKCFPKIEWAAWAYDYLADLYRGKDFGPRNNIQLDLEEQKLILDYLRCRSNNNPNSQTEYYGVYPRLLKRTKSWVYDFRLVVSNKRIYRCGFNTSLEAALARDKYIKDNNLQTRHKLNFS